jgi:protein tyrosine/serine phosphatase
MTDGNQGPHWVVLEGAANARVVVPGALLRSDNLQSLTPRDVQVLVGEERVEVVVDLRTDIEVQLEGPGPMAAVAGVRIEHRSLYPDSGGNTDFDLETIKPWKRAREDGFPEEEPIVRAYLSYLARRPDSMVGAIRTIASSHAAVLVHCAAGKDRTGMVVAVALDAAGVDRDTVVGDYMASADRIEQIMARLLSSATYRTDLEGHDPQQHAPTRETMERVLEIIDARYGGSAAWLTANGLSQADLEQLRSRLAPATATSALG